MDWIVSGVLVNLLSEFLVVVAGVLFSQFIRNRLDKHRFGGWKVTVKRAGIDIDVRPVSSGKIKQIHEIPEELSVFLKGVTSGYGWINCDLETRGRELGMLVENKLSRPYIIDLDQNPPTDGAPAGEPDQAARPTLAPQ